MSATAGPGGMRHFDVQAITDVGAWRALAGEWDRVLRATEGYTPLQSFDFLATWWECMAGNRALWILVFRDELAQIAGIAPLQISPRTILGKRYRTVQFLGMTEDILVPTLLFPSSNRAQLRAAFIEYLAKHQAAWDLIELDELAASDPLAEDLKALSQRCGLIHRERPFHDCPFLDLRGQTAETFFAQRSRKLLKNLRASERKLAALGAVSVQTYRSGAEIEAGLRQFLELEQLSWKRQAAVGMSSDGRYATFYQRLLQVFSRNHQTCVMVLKSGERPLAATLAIVFDRIYCSLQIVHDERYARFSPGTLLELHEMQGLLADGSLQRYEFLGGALANKLRWTSTVISTRCVYASKPQIRTRLLDLYEFRAKPVAKRVLRRIGFLKPLPSQQSAA